MRRRRNKGIEDGGFGGEGREGGGKGGGEASISPPRLFSLSAFPPVPPSHVEGKVEDESNDEA